MMDIASLEALAWPIAAVLAAGFGASAFTSWLRIRNGYPLENSWGKALYPQKDAETAERLKLVTQENAQLRAEIGSVKDRLANVERIVTDSGYRLSHDIERLRDGRENMQ